MSLDVKKHLSLLTVVLFITDRSLTIWNKSPLDVFDENTFKILMSFVLITRYERQQGKQR